VFGNHWDIIRKWKFLTSTKITFAEKTKIPSKTWLGFLQTKRDSITASDFTYGQYAYGKLNLRTQDVLGG
jgi:hypothetical protein